MVKIVQSGAQAGVDQAGISAAYYLGIKTGGTSPKGYRTLYGNMPNLKKFGIIEHESEDYAPRTFCNVKNSDGTIRFAYDFESAGEICTLKAIKQYNRPYFDFDLNSDYLFQVFDAIDWINDNNIEILNVAGNAGKNKEESMKIYNVVRDLMIKILKDVNKIK